MSALLGPLLTHAVALAAGLALAWLLWRGRLGASAERAVLEERLRGRDAQIAALEADAAAAAEELERRRAESASRQVLIAQLETSLEAERRAAAEKLRVVEMAQEKLSDSFKALSAEALASNNTSFLHLANATLERFQESAKGDLEQRQRAIDELVRPLQESLVQVDRKIHEIEKDRAVAFGGLSDHLKSLAAGQSSLERETAKLVNALR